MTAPGASTRIGFGGLCGLLCLALAILAIRPDWDLAVARVFFVGRNHFIGDTRAGIIVRYAAWILPFAVFLCLCLAALGRRLGLIAARFAPSGSSIAFLTLSLLLGPGIIVHSTLKELSHRPRPYHLADFGGTEAFRPFTHFDGACRHNCAFPSGETAAATWLVAPASLTPLPWRGAAIVGALVFAAATGLLRMAFGAHFLSDVCGAALITLLVVAACRWLISARMRRDGRDL